MSRRLLVLLSVAIALPPVQALAQYVPRTGFVTLQFDDSHETHYTHIFPILEQHGFKGSFGYVVEVSELGIEHDAWKMVEIYQAGHEVQDHTTRHDYMWATHVDTVDDGITDWIEYTFADVATWDSLCERSLEILDSLGIQVVGWNKPGGGTASIPGHPGWRWRGAFDDSMYALIGTKYPYAICYGVYPNTAHLNHRGHNCPDRYSFYNVPHWTIDGMALGDVKTDIADAAASGLWYLAVSHAVDMSQVTMVDSLAQWLDDEDIEVLTCYDAWQRVWLGDPDPLENQLPHARMLNDLDDNSKPDGFTGLCMADTATAPVDSAKCMYLEGETAFFCYGPEVGPSAFSMWFRSATDTSSIIRVISTALDFDWNNIGECWNVFEVSPEWTRFDTLNVPGFAIDVSEDVDRIKFTIRLPSGLPILAAYPDFRLASTAGVEDGITCPRHHPAIRVTPNPVITGTPLMIEMATPALVCDVCGRLVFRTAPGPNSDWTAVNTAQLGPGVFFVTDPSHSFASTKVVVLR
jgi:peptidoglycan/xylan/chitin deacetylase (PgdA/CDA1 family)